jgi:hypothetical protein
MARAWGYWRNQKGKSMKLLPTIAISLSLAFGTGGLACAQDAPMASPNAPGNPVVKSPSDTGPAALAKGHNSFTKGQARTRIEKAGYTQVAGLMKNSDGLWQGSAMQDGKSVQVSLDYQGHVAAQ